MHIISITFKLSKSDFINGNDVLYFCTNPRKVINILFLILFISLSGINIYFGIILKDNISLGIGITLILLPILVEIMRRFRNVRFYNKSKVCSEEINYTFDDEKIKRRSESYYTEYKVSSINKVINSKNWIFLFLNNGQQNLIPKKAFEETDLNILKEIFDQNKVKNNL
jgi:hypothetical protein